MKAAGGTDERGRRWDRGGPRSKARRRRAGGGGHVRGSEAPAPIPEMPVRDGEAA